MEEKPLYKKIIYAIEDDILKGKYKEDDIIVSTTEISKSYHVNSTTAMKAITILRENGIIYKQRGVGMAVTTIGSEIVRKKRIKIFFEQLVPEIIAEAKKLEIKNEELVELIVKKGKH